MRALWSQEVASFAGEFARFERIRVNPKPVAGRVPVVLGGNSDAALRRAAAWGDGWYGFNLESVDAVRDRVALLPEREGFEIAVALQSVEPGDLPVLEAAGVTQLVLVEGPPDDPGEARAWVHALAGRWIARRG